MLTKQLQVANVSVSKAVVTVSPLTVQCYVVPLLLQLQPLRPLLQHIFQVLGVSLKLRVGGARRGRLGSEAFGRVTHIHTHACTNACTHARTHMHTQTHTHTHARTHAHKHTHKHTHARTHAHTHLQYI